MNEVVHIGNSDIFIKEYNGQRVVTFKDIDMVHERPDGTAKRNFASNKDKFIEKEDYYIIPYSEFSTKFVRSSKGGNPNVPVVLITEQGYFMLVKSFTDDLAWSVQRQLVNGYFRARKPLNEELSPQLQIIGQMFQAMAEKEIADRERDRKISEAKQIAEKAVQTTENIKEAVQPVFDNWKEQMNKKFNKIQQYCQCDFSVLRNEMYSVLEQRASCNLGQRVRNEQKRMYDRGRSKTEINNYRKIDAINNDKKLREIFSKIVAEYEIKYCV